MLRIRRCRIRKSPPPDAPVPTPSDKPEDPQEPEQNEPALVVTTPGDKIAAGAELTATTKGFKPVTRLDAALTTLFAPFTRTAVASDVVTDERSEAKLSFTIPSDLKDGMYSFSVGPVGEDPEAFAVVNIAASASTPEKPQKPEEAGPKQPEAPLPAKEEGPSPDGIITSKDKVEIDHGHLDLLTAIVKNRALHLVLKDDSTGTPVLRDPADVTLRVRRNALTTLGKDIAPNLPEKGYFLDAGGLNQQELLFPGWDTNGVRPNYGEVDFEIVKMTAPEGTKAYMFNTKPFGGVAPAFTNGDLEIKDGATIRQQRPAHVHTNWLFSAPGVYTMEVRAKASPLLGIGFENLTSRTTTYTWKVGEDENEPVPEKPEPEPQKPETGPSTPQSDSNGQGAPAAPEAPNASAPSGESPRGSVASPSSAAKCFPKTEGGSGADALIPQIKDDRTAPGTWVDPTTLTFSIGEAGRATTPMDIGAIPKGTGV